MSFLRNLFKTTPQADKKTDFNKWLIEQFVRAEWEPGCPATIISESEGELGRNLPDDYLEFLTCSNGIEGITKGNVRIQLWSVVDLPRYNQEYEVAKNVPDLLLIGSNLGGEAFAIDYRGDSPMYVQVPFVPMEREYVQVLGPTFQAFIERVEA